MDNNTVNIVINSLTQGGAEKVAINLSEKFSEFKIKNIILLQNNINFYNNKKNTINLSQKEKSSPIEKILNLYSYFKHERGPIISFSLDLSFYLVFLKKMNLIDNKIICRFINNPESEVSGSLIKNIKKKLLFYFLKKSDVILCQSDAMIKSLIDNYNFPKSKLVRIYNPVLKPELTNLSNRKDNILRLLFVGRLTHQKNLSHIISIAKELKKQNKKFLWVILGNGEEKLILHDEIKNNNLSKNILLLGPKNNTDKYYRWADATTLVSHYEGLPNVLLESISYGTPCISYDCKTGPSEIIKENINGFLIPQYDILLFAEMLNINKLRKLKSSNLYYTIPNFHSDIVIKQYISLIKNN
ncbi:glycosyltransferase [Providencia rettgeri]|uniref:glycosyltransferase n=1 Tax=Providencia sp. PROV247 TaxID=2949938 RepID=UPI00234A80C1|nr:glycosyltransferase [Providencia sp. PROV247]